MSSKFSRIDILQMLNDLYTDSFILKQAAEVQSVPPVVALGRYVASVVVDLYGRDSNEGANRERIAQALDLGADTLARMAGRLREG